MYGGRETDAQAWDRKRKQRIQQLAWMYGVDPSMITGEMTNPWYDNTQPALDWKYANQGGIMDLDAEVKLVDQELVHLIQLTLKYQTVSLL